MPETASIIPVSLAVGTCFIIQGERTVIVDTGYPGNGDRIIRHLRKHSISLPRVSLIILTHGHIDHYGSAGEIRAATEAPIAIHNGDAESLSKGINRLGAPAGLSGRLFKLIYKNADVVRSRPLDADIIIDKDTDLKEFGIDGKVIHTPGHTDGSVSVILSGGEAIVGDLVMGGIFLRRTPRYPLFVTDMEALRSSIRKIVALSPRIVYASHGGPFSVSSLQRLAKRSVE